VTRRFNTWTDLFLSGTTFLPDRVGFCALREDGSAESIGRAELVNHALSVSRGLRSLGLQKGSVVVLTGEPSTAWAVSFAAVLLSGAMPAPIYARSTRQEFERAMATSGAQFAIVAAASGVVDLSERGSTRTIITLERTGGPHPSVEEMYELAPTDPVVCAESDPAVVLQTSGTTGNPKFVVHTHRSHMEYLDGMVENTMSADDRVLSFMPLNHQAGLLVFWIAAFSVGAPSFQLSRFSTGAFWDAIHTYGITWTGLMDPVPAHLLNAEPSDKDRNHTLRFVLGQSNASNRAATERRFGFQIHGSYGSTEAPIVALSTDLERPAFLGLTTDQASVCGGVPVRDWEARVVRPDGSRAPQSEIGSLEVRGPALFSRYLNDPEATIRAISADGWYKTGDRAYVNEHGEIFFVEREGANSIRRSGEFISAAEVETTLLQHPGISDACVVAVPDDLRYQEVRACVVRTPGSAVTAQEIYDHCSASLAKFKVPRFLDFWDELPRTATLKIARTELDSDPATWIDRYDSRATDMRP